MRFVHAEGEEQRALEATPPGRVAEAGRVPAALREQPALGLRPTDFEPRQRHAAAHSSARTETSRYKTTFIFVVRLKGKGSGREGPSPLPSTALVYYDSRAAFSSYAARSRPAWRPT